MTQITPVALTVFIKSITDSGASFWMQTRKEEGHLQGLWEFPGGKIETNEAHDVAACREVKEEVGVEVGKPTLFKLYHHDYSEHSVCLYVHLSDERNLPVSEEQKWFELNFENRSKSLIGMIPEINHLIVDDVLGYLQKLLKSQNIDSIWPSSRL